MERREFLIRLGSVIVVVPIGYGVAACGNNNENRDGGIISVSRDGGSTTAGPDGGGTASTDAGTSTQALIFTSSRVAGHTHTVQIRLADITDPPASGLRTNTSVVDDHLHVVILTTDDLNAIDANQTVTKITSVTNGHDHTFTLQKSAP